MWRRDLLWLPYSAETETMKVGEKATDMQNGVSFFSTNSLGTPNKQRILVFQTHKNSIIENFETLI
jgi:hypothetical protein